MQAWMLRRMRSGSSCTWQSPSSPVSCTMGVLHTTWRPVNRAFSSLSLMPVAWKVGSTFTCALRISSWISAVGMFSRSFTLLALATAAFSSLLAPLPAITSGTGRPLNTSRTSHNAAWSFSGTPSAPWYRQ